VKRHIFNSFITILVILINISLGTNLNIKNFDATKVKSITEYLSSPSFKGRLTGTRENRLAAEYIKSWFIHNNLAPYEGDYFDSFEVIYPQRIDKTPHLRVVDKNGDIIHEYTYALDYKEDMLNFKENQVIFNNNNSRQIDNNIIRVLNNNNAFIFYVDDKDKLSFRSSFSSDSLVSMCVFLTESTFASIKDYLDKDFFVECYIPFKQEKTTVENVLGVIEGRDKSKPPIILSSHYDHLGSDLSGTVYSGALDNASGTAFIMEMARFLQSVGQPERSIIFIAFNAEEFGCLGSKAFVEEYKNNLLGSKVFNFDMIGSDNGVPLCIMGAESDTANTELIKSTAAACIDENIHFNYLFKDSSDHEYFRKNGIDAITFCDNDMSKIHTPKDTSNYISEKAIERCFSVVSKEVLRYAYNNDPYVLYNKEILLYSFIGLSVLIVLAVLYSELSSD
jgi:hypothetical protein